MISVGITSIFLSFLHHSKQSGVMYQSLPAAGSEYHDLPPDPEWTMWSRMDFGRAHGQGIVDNLFREFLLSLVPRAKRQSLHDMFEVVRHPRGSSKVHHCTDENGKFTKSGEQLHKKRLFRTCFLGLSFVSCFDDGSEKSNECMKVHLQISSPLQISRTLLVHSSFGHGGCTLR